MEDKEIIKALECCTSGTTSECCNKCPFSPEDICDKDGNALEKYALALINRQKETINRQKAEIEKLEKDAKEVRHKFDCLVCHSTGGRLSKSTYPLRTMETAVTDYINECYDEVEAEASAEAVKEFAKRVRNYIKTNCNPYGKPTLDYETSIAIMHYIDNLVKEFTGGGDGNQSL